MLAMVHNKPAYVLEVQMSQRKAMKSRDRQRTNKNQQSTINVFNAWKPQRLESEKIL